MTASVNLSAPLVQKFWDNAGNPASGCKLFTYAAGTNTKQPVYTDSTGLVPCTDPIILDATGSATFWPDTSLTYKFVLAPANDTDPPTSPIWTRDGVQTPANTASAAAAAAAAAQPYVNAASTSATSAAGSATVAGVALSTANIFANTTNGLAATSGTGTTNRYFAIPSGTSNGYLDLYRNDAGTPTFLNTYPSLAGINAYLDSVTKSAYLFSQKTSTFVLGTSVTPITGGTGPTHTFVYATPVPKDGAVTALQFYASGTGTLKLKRLNSAYSEVANIVLNCVSGLNAFTTKDLGTFLVSAGDHIGWYSSVLCSNTGMDGRSSYYDGGAGDLTTPAHASILNISVYQIQPTITYAATNASSDVLNNAEVSRFRDEAKVVHRIGNQADTIPDGTASDGGGYHLFFADPAARAGRVAKVRAYASAAQYLQLWAWDRSGDTATLRSDPLDIFYIPAGYSETVLDLPVEAGVYFSLLHSGLRFNASTKFPGRGYLVAAAGASTLLLDGSVTASTNTLHQVGLELEYSSYIGQVQKHRVSLGRTDSIALIGNSFGAGAYQPYKKTWLAMASQFSAWNFHNYSLTSQDLAQRLANIRTAVPQFYTNAGDGNAYGTGSNGDSYRDYRNTYALIILGQNEASAATLLNNLHDVLETVRASGAIPILASEIANVLHELAIYRQMAERYGGYFVDLSQYLTMFPNVYAGFGGTGGIHKSYRVAGSLYGTHLVRAIEATIGAPRTGIKIYRPRPGFSYATAADFMFEQGDDLRHVLNTKWQEILMGGGTVFVGDANVAYLDSIQTAGFATTAQTYSEYLQAERGHPVSFTDYALLSFHLDAQPQQCREVRAFVGTGHTNIYARTVYTNGSYPASGGQQGFWTTLPVTSDGWAIVREWEMSGKLSGSGRIDFLVEHAGAFTLQNPRAEWWGESNKIRTNPVSLSRPRGAELIAQPFPYASGALAAGWAVASGTPTYAATANGGDLPKSATGYVRLTSADAINYVVTGITADPFYGREVEICVWASAERALVDHTTYPTGASITGDSWDCEQILISHVNSGNAATSIKTLMPYWQEVRVKTWLEAGATTATVKLGCNTSGAVLVARASTKLVDG